MLTPRDAWQATLGQLQLQLNRSTFETWLKGSEVLAYEDGDFIIRVRHAYAKDWLDQHLRSQITEILGGILKRTVQVNFVVYLPNRQRLDPSDIGPLFANSPARPIAEPAQDDAVAAPANWLHEDAEWDPRVTYLRHSTNREIEAPRNALPLDRRFTFESFVTGPSNHFAHAAALAVSDTPGKRFNPLVIYGGVGLGKTHLLQSLGNKGEDTGSQVVYITAEAFTNELVESIRAQKTEDFRARYRSIDLLLLDDIQFMAGKTATEEEFYHTFNAICSQGGQIGVVCNQHPRQIGRLDERIRSRLEGGLLVDIQPPEFETRFEIVTAKASAQGIMIPAEVASVLAHYDTANIRELEGLLNQVLARVLLSHEPLTMALARHIIEKNCGPTSTPRARRSGLTDVFEATATYHQLSLDDLLGKSRAKKVVRARHIAMYLAREETDATLPQIGDALGGRDHSTILHGCQKIADEMNDSLRRELSAIRNQLHLFSND